MGQTREVAVYQLVSSGTVEERILQAARNKMAIERLVVSEAEKAGRTGIGGGGDIFQDGVGAGAKAAADPLTRAANIRQVLLHGVGSLLSDDGGGGVELGSKGWVPTDAEVEKLLDRSAIPEDTEAEDAAAYLGARTRKHVTRETSSRRRRFTPVDR